MNKLMQSLYCDEAGYIVSGEMVLIASLVILAMIVGLSEVSHNILHEMEDIGSAFGSVNQSFTVSGATGHFGEFDASSFVDPLDLCDAAGDIGVDVTAGGEATP